ncbi:MAG: undecaprenyl/decaprenyl-phosphate alpha-N-acetylglucosaminyl 1-phosphate transferase [Desulfarculaceae bacterium]|nr:undecaprenyl/decaprenyl-phosphate alpha-N-acetylglucosaminyl 1-phosphate transferase [Desulfarculaceae bacterium]
MVFLASLASILVLLPWLPPSWTAIPQIGQKGLAFLLGACLILLIGILDDVYGMRARWKLLGQIIVALVVWAAGLRVEVLTNLLDPADPIRLGVWSLPLFVCWVVLCVNAMNIIDGLDGLAGGIFALGITFFLINCLVLDMHLLALTSAALLGAVGFFLLKNIRKEMYLGDSGSLLLGYILACVVPFSTPKSAGVASVLVPLGVLSVPLAEVLATTLRRIYQGKPISNADQGHIHHRLLKSGLKVRQVAILINTVCFICGLLALSMTLVFQPTVAAVLGLLWLIVLVFFFGMGYRNLPHGNGAAIKTRNTLFLDVERIMHAKMHKLSKCGDAEIMRKVILELIEHINLDGFSIWFIDKSGNRVSVEKPVSLEPADSQEYDCQATLKVQRRDNSRLVGEAEATVGISEEDKDFDSTIYWLNSLLVNLCKCSPQGASDLGEARDDT